MNLVCCLVLVDLAAAMSASLGWRNRFLQSVLPEADAAAEQNYHKLKPAALAANSSEQVLAETIAGTRFFVLAIDSALAPKLVVDFRFPLSGHGCRRMGFPSEH